MKRTKHLGKIILLTNAIFMFCCADISAQNTRLKNYNNLGWYNYFGTFTIHDRWDVYTEYQWRRVEFGKKWQQSLAKAGVNYKPNPKLLLRLGYAWAETFAYGDIPLNGFGKTFTEHRIFQAAIINDKIKNIGLSHRFMLEQRWVGRYSDPSLKTEDDFVYTNRMRYLFRTQIPLGNASKNSRLPYLALYDEILVGFGKNVNENVFDQNRIGILLGYSFSPLFRLEAGYLNQVVQLGREVNNRNVFQHNNGLIINLNFNVDLRKTPDAAMAGQK